MNDGANNTNYSHFECDFLIPNNTPSILISNELGTNRILKEWIIFSPLSKYPTVHPSVIAMILCSQKKFIQQLSLTSSST